MANETLSVVGKGGFKIRFVDLGDGTFAVATKEVTGTAGSGSVPTVGVNSSVAVGITSTALVAANTARTSVLLQNNGTASVWLGFGAAAVLNSGFELVANQVITVPFQVSINGVVSTGTSNVNVLETVNA